MREARTSEGTIPVLGINSLQSDVGYHGEDDGDPPGGGRVGEGPSETSANFPSDARVLMPGSFVFIRHKIADVLSGRPGVDVPEAMQQKIDREGLSPLRLFAGLAGLSLVTFVYGRYPEHAWVLYGLKCWLLIPLWYSRVIHWRRGWWYVMEPCWMINVWIAIYLTIAALNLLDREVSQWLFRSFFMLALGFLGWSVVVSKNGLIWHSISTTAAIVIHLIPTLVCLTLRWQHELEVDVEKAWPGRFPTVAEMEATETIDLLISGLVSYAIWWVIYLVWLMTIGLGLPARGWPTIYNNFQRKQKNLFGKFGIESPRVLAAIYMILHFALCTVSFAWSILCWRVYYVHLAWTLVLLSFCIWMGAGYYVDEVIQTCVPNPPAPDPPEEEPPQRVFLMEEDYD